MSCNQTTPRASQTATTPLQQRQSALGWSLALRRHSAYRRQQQQGCRLEQGSLLQLVHRYHPLLLPWPLLLLVVVPDASSGTACMGLHVCR